MGKQVSFDIISNLLFLFAARVLPPTLEKHHKQLFVSLGSAFLASVVACLFSQPGDMILTATYNAQGGGHGHGDARSALEVTDASFAAIVRSIYQRHGLAGFFLGVQARLVHVASIITVQLVIYDALKAALGLPVTGSH
jgi:solute carrier family 25 phosphate transporter 3